MAKCPLNSFNECYGSECEWYISNKGLCSTACIAENTEDISTLSLFFQYLKSVHKYQQFDK